MEQMTKERFFVLKEFKKTMIQLQDVEKKIAKNK